VFYGGLAIAPSLCAVKFATRVVDFATSVLGGGDHDNLLALL